MRIKAEIMDEAAMNRALKRIGHEIVEQNAGIEDLLIVGIQRRGVPLARRIAAQVAAIEGEEPEVGTLDITFYRDDLSLLSESPTVNATDIQANLNNRKVLLVDDVIYTGRTIRAAIEALFDMGRPAAIQLATLIDRGHRELPLRPDYVGKNIPTAKSEQIEVFVKEVDGSDKVLLGERVEA